MSDIERDGMITLPEGLIAPTAGDGARGGSPSGGSPSAAAQGAGGVDESVEETVVVDREQEAYEAAEETIIVDRSAEFEGAGYEAYEATVVVERTGERTGHPVDEATVVVERTGERTGHPVDEATVVVERTGERTGHPVDAETVVVERTGERGGAPTQPSDAADEATAIRQSASGPAMAHPAASVMNAPTRRSRRSLKPAPVSDDVLQTAEHGPGAGVLDAYPSRPAEPLRMPIPDLGAGPAPTRDVHHELPSVAKRSRRTAIIGLAAIGGAVVVGLAGFVWVCATVVGSLFG